MFVAQSAAPTVVFVQPTIVSSSIAPTGSFIMPSHAVGDLIVLFEGRSNSATPPTKPAAGGTVPAWLDIDAANGTVARSMRTAYVIATATNHTTGTWTNATLTGAMVFRGVGATPIGGHAKADASATANSTSPAITLAQSDGTSQILTIHTTAAGVLNSGGALTPPAGWTRNFSQASACFNLKTSTTSDGTSVQACGGTGLVNSATVEICAH